MGTRQIFVQRVRYEGAITHTVPASLTSLVKTFAKAFNTFELVYVSKNKTVDLIFCQEWQVVQSWTTQVCYTKTLFTPKVHVGAGKEEQVFASQNEKKES